MLPPGERSRSLYRIPRMIATDDRGEGAPLVLLHGVGASRSVWRQVTPRLCVDRRVLSPDLPGLGESQACGQGFALHTVAERLAEDLDDRVGEPFDLLGNSLGGAVAVELAHLRPELVRTLILAAPAGFSVQPFPLPFLAETLFGPAMRLRRVLGAPLAGSPTARRALFWGAIADPDRLEAREALAMLQASRGSTRLGAAVSAAVRTDLGHRLRALDVPLGAIWGRRDRIVPISRLERIRSLRPDVLVETIDGAAHVPQLEQPRAFVGAVCRILEQLHRSPGLGSV